jgi:hypothetical protein
MHTRRYCHGGALLWPQAEPPQPSRCARCGGARVFELQLMPALAQLALEAADMLRAAQQDDAGAALPFDAHGACRGDGGGRGVNDVLRKHTRTDTPTLPPPPLHAHHSRQRGGQLGLVHGGGVHVCRQLLWWH